MVEKEMSVARKECICTGKCSQSFGDYDISPKNKRDGKIKLEKESAQKKTNSLRLGQAQWRSRCRLPPRD
jgi:hypothetical protein